MSRLIRAPVAVRLSLSAVRLSRPLLSFPHEMLHGVLARGSAAPSRPGVLPSSAPFRSVRLRLRIPKRFTFFTIKKASPPRAKDVGTSFPHEMLHGVLVRGCFCWSPSLAVRSPSLPAAPSNHPHPTTPTVRCAQTMLRPAPTTGPSTRRAAPNLLSTGSARFSKRRGRDRAPDFLGHAPDLRYVEFGGPWVQPKGVQPKALPHSDLAGTYSGCAGSALPPLPH